MLKAIEAENIMRSHNRQHNNRNLNFHPSSRNEVRRDFNPRSQPIVSSSQFHKNPISSKPQYDAKPRYDSSRKPMQQLPSLRIYHILLVTTAMNQVIMQVHVRNLNHRV